MTAPAAADAPIAERPLLNATNKSTPAISRPAHLAIPAPKYGVSVHATDGLKWMLSHSGTLACSPVA